MDRERGKGRGEGESLRDLGKRRRPGWVGGCLRSLIFC